MNTKKLAGAGAAIGAVTAVTALLLGTTAAVAQETASDSAFGLSASGLLKIDPISYVESPDGKHVEKQLLGIGDVLGPHEGDIAFGVLTAEAQGGASETAVTELNLLQLLRADLVRTYCNDGDGGLQIVKGSILGHDLPETPVPSQTLDLSPLLKLTLNDQVRHEDGSLTVTGIELTVLPGGDQNPDRVLTSEERKALPQLADLLGTDPTAGANTVGDVVTGVTGKLGIQVDPSKPLQTITIGSATCSASNGNGDAKSDGNNGNGDGNGNGDNNGDNSGANATAGDTGPVATAPKPQVLNASLPVTG
ncbi:MAG: hypothetical protein JWR58_450 [Pseudonocardia sp.]|nr:hypothetical protein [Pseudonocardia sp.]